MAQTLAGVLLITGEGTSKDPKAGFAWVKRAADAGDSAASIILATLYIEGTGTPPDPEAARALLQTVYARRDEQAPTAAYHLGWLYMEGKGIPVDRVKAFRWMVLGARGEIPEAESRLATLINQLPRRALITACSVLVTPYYADNGVQRKLSANAGEVFVTLSSTENSVEVFLVDRSILGWVSPRCVGSQNPAH